MPVGGEAMELVQNAEARKGERTTMVRSQIAGRGVNDQRVLSSMESLPRELFVPPGQKPYAYEDRALPIGHGQTISQPYIVALMLQLADLRGEEKVLEIGTGSGYATALLSLLAAEVITIERIRPLAVRAKTVLDELKRDNVRYFVGDGSGGKAEFAPYDVVIVWAAARTVPAALFGQLSIDGCLISPEGQNYDPEEGRDYQTLVRYRKNVSGIDRTEVCSVSFVPLVSDSSE